MPVSLNLLKVVNMLTIKETIRTENKFPVIIQASAIFLVALLFVIISLSVVVNPQFVKREIA